MTDARVPVDIEAIDETAEEVTTEGSLAVFRNPSFLRLWLSQAATQIGGQGD